MSIIFLTVTIGIIGWCLIWRKLWSKLPEHTKNNGETVQGAMEYLGYVILLIWAFILPTITLYNQIDDVGIVRKYFEVVNVQNERIDNLKNQCKFVMQESKAQTIMNADSPISALIGQLAQAEEDLAKAKTVVANAKFSIEKRSLGFHGFITKIVQP